jgi:AraC family transcriptional regulator
VGEKTPSRRVALDYRRRICRAMNLISANLDRDLSLQEIAAESAFSPFHFHRIFKAVVGETVGAFTRRLRLESAASRLQSPVEVDITTIALDCGFATSQSFAKAFRQHFGCSPSEYRRNHDKSGDSKNGHINSNGETALSLQAVYNPDSLDRMDEPNARSQNMNAEIKQMPEFNVAYVRKLGPYGKETCEAAFAELMAWAGPRGYIGQGPMLGLYWDNPEVTDHARCRVDACVVVPEGVVPDSPVDLQTVPGGPHAVCHFEIKADSFQQAWEDSFAWLVSQGHECADKPTYELYHADPEHHPEGKWVFDICIPLK